MSSSTRHQAAARAVGGARVELADVLVLDSSEYVDLGSELLLLPCARVLRQLLDRAWHPIQLGFVHDTAAAVANLVAVTEVACGGLQVGVLHLRGVLRRSIASGFGLLAVEALVHVATSRPLPSTQCSRAVINGEAFVGIEFRAFDWIQSIRVHVERW